MAEKDVGKDVATEENTVAKDIVVTKYKMAAEIVNGMMIILVFRNCQFSSKLWWYFFGDCNANISEHAAVKDQFEDFGISKWLFDRLDGFGSCLGRAIG